MTAIPPEPEKRGLSALIGFSLALAGACEQAYPGRFPWAAGLLRARPILDVSTPFLMMVCGSVMAFASHPPPELARARVWFHREWSLLREHVRLLLRRVR